MRDEQDLEQRLSRYRPAGPSAEFEARLLRAARSADASTVSRPRFSRYAFSLAASVLMVACLFLALAGHMETARLRALMTEPEPSTGVRESERMLELEFGPEVMALKRQLDATRAAARIPRERRTLDPATWEELR